MAKPAVDNGPEIGRAELRGCGGRGSHSGSVLCVARWRSRSRSGSTSLRRWKMHDLDVRPLARQPLNGGATAVRGTVVDDPEYPRSGSIGFMVHDLANQLVEGGDTRFRGAVTEQLGMPDIPGREVTERTAALVLMFDAHRLPRPWATWDMLAQTRLDARLLVGADDHVVGGQGARLPAGGHGHRQHPDGDAGAPRAAQRGGRRSSWCSASTSAR